MTDQDQTAATTPRYDAEGRCLDCGGVGGCHSLDCPPMAAKYDEAERSAAQGRRERLRRAVEDGERLYRKRMHDPAGPDLNIADDNRRDGILTLDLTDALGFVDELLAENEELRGRLKLACLPCAECGHVDWRELDNILETR